MPEGPLPNNWLSVDPGDVHAAIAKWEGTKCTGTIETSPRQALLIIERKLQDNEIDGLIYERFALDPRRAGQQSGSEFLTSQMIGVLKWLCEVKYSIYIEGYLNREHKTVYHQGWYKSLTLKDKRRLPWWGQGTGEHCKDAWCVGMWHKHMRGHGQYGVD